MSADPISPERRFFDVLMIIPLEEEHQQFITVFSEQEDLSTALQYRSVVDCGNPEIRALLVQQEDMGKGPASKAVTQVLRDYDVGLIICAGIAGGLSKDLLLGDVCYSGTIVDVYDNSKVSGSADDEATKWSPSYHDTPRNLTQALNYSRVSPDLRGSYAAWQDAALERAASLALGPHLGRDGKPQAFSRPSTKPGTIACAAVTDSPTYNSRLLGLNRRMLAVETESGGVFEQADVYALDVLVVRGISDYADPAKGQLEQSSKNTIRAIAALNAATYIKLQFSNPWFLRIVDGIRAKRRKTAQTLFSEVTSRADPLIGMLSTLDELVDSRLRDLSPAFKLQPRGYKLPVPRIRHIDLDAGTRVAQSKSHPAIDIRDVISTSKRILVRIQRTYPDKGLPWIIASELLTHITDGKQVVPVVIKGSNIRPPRSGLISLADIDIASLKERDSLSIVFVVNEPPFDSRTGTRFLVEEMERWPNATFIFLSPAGAFSSQETDFIQQTRCTTFELTDVSFREISHFVEKNFDLSGSEAQVVALRLRRTFSQFKLAAHPTYFAGLARETLSALLQANRRSELIQLAVDGFLTFLVADDKSEIVVRRTTRARFLRQLAYEIRVKRRSFSRSDLVNFTQTFLDASDFDVDALEFISGFTERGIIHFSADEARISLPFIEAYLLAVELRDRRGEELAYFSLKQADFDMLTFDLYCELGPSPEVVVDVTKALEEAIVALRLPDESSSILLSGDIRPNYLSRQDRLIKLQERVQKAIDQAGNDNGDVEEKQRLIDMADRVEESSSRKMREASSTGDQVDADEAFASAVKAWAVGCALLGSGAEYLPASDKRALSALIIKLAVLLIERWTSLYRKIDFDRFRTEITSSNLVDELVRGKDTEGTRRETVATLEMMVDVLEFSVLSDPFRRILNHLCEEGRHRVLAVSVENSEVAGKIEELIKGVWLVDVGAPRGERLLEAALKGFGSLPFLRFNLANHFLARAFWSQSSIQHRYTLVGLADRSTKAIGVTFETSEIRDLIANDDERRRSGIDEEDAP